jgi:hypothetical protein
MILHTCTCALSFYGAAHTPATHDPDEQSLSETHPTATVGEDRQLFRDASPFHRFGIRRRSRLDGLAARGFRDAADAVT